MISGRETLSPSTVSTPITVGIMFDCGFIIGMSTDTFGILLGNVIYAAYIGVLSESESELCSNGKRIREGNHSGTVSQCVCDLV